MALCNLMGCCIIISSSVYNDNQPMKGSSPLPPEKGSSPQPAWEGTRMRVVKKAGFYTGMSTVPAPTPTPTSVDNYLPRPPLVSYEPEHVRGRSLASYNGPTNLPYGPITYTRTTAGSQARIVGDLPVVSVDSPTCPVDQVNYVRYGTVQELPNPTPTPAGRLIPPTPAPTPAPMGCDELTGRKCVSIAPDGISNTDCVKAFCPPLTRGEMAALIIRAKMNSVFPTVTSGAFTNTSCAPPGTGVTQVGDRFGLFAGCQPYFSDVPATHQYSAYIQKMRELRITNGTSLTTKPPPQPTGRNLRNPYFSGLSPRQVVGN